MCRLVTVLLIAGAAACSQGKNPPASRGTPTPVKPNAMLAPSAPAPSAPAPSVPAPDLTPTSQTTVEVICRDAWGAKKPTRSGHEHKIKRLTLHHSGTPFRRNDRGPRRLRSAQRYHQGKAKGWHDIAYHYLLDLQGNIYEGRSTRHRGDTGTSYDTTGHFLVCLIGDYSQQTVNEAQAKALISLLAWASTAHGVSPETITGHRDHAATACPGKDLHARIKSGEIRQRVEQALATRTFKLQPICGDEAHRRVAAITNQGIRGHQ